MTSHSLAKGLKAEGSRCAQHRGWAGRAAPCTAAPGGKASSTEMLNCFFHPFSSRAHLLPFLSLHALLQSQPLTFPATTRLTQSWLFYYPLQHPLRAGASPDLSAAAFAQQRVPLNEKVTFTWPHRSARCHPAPESSGASPRTEQN